MELTFGEEDDLTHIGNINQGFVDQLIKNGFEIVRTGNTAEEVTQIQNEELSGLGGVLRVGNDERAEFWAKKKK